jgi:hypothetical protein
MEFVPDKVVMFGRGGGSWIRELEYAKNNKASSVAKYITVRRARRPTGVDRR